MWNIFAASPIWNSFLSEKSSSSGKGMFGVFGPNRLADGYGRSHGKPYDHDSQHMHNLAADRDGGNLCHAVELTDNKEVHHTIQSLQKI